ncbi:MAG: Gfo/Idh/MocA family protein [Acidimicrobiales bacterium]
MGIGLIGVGWMGRLHSQSYRRVNYHYPELELRPDLVIAADLVAERAKLASDEFGYTEWTKEWRKVVTHPGVDAVSITAPNYLHKEIALAAAENGKHFWIEKPLGRNRDETAAIAGAARSAGIVTAVGFNYRHAPAVQWARELVRTGQIGRVNHVRGIFFNGYAADPRGALSWRFQRSLGGSGALGDLMSHTVDLLQHIVGPISSVTSLKTTVITERPELPMGVGTHFMIVEDGELRAVENEDYVGTLVRFECGAVGTCEASRVTVGPQCQIAFDIYGSEGAVSWDFERMNELRACIGPPGPNNGYRTLLAGPGHGDYARFQPGPGIAMSYDDLKVVEAELYLKSIATGEQVGASVADALRAAEVLEAAERAAVSATWESVSTDEASSRSGTGNEL